MYTAHNNNCSKGTHIQVYKQFCLLTMKQGVRYVLILSHLFYFWWRLSASFPAQNTVQVFRCYSREILALKIPLVPTIRTSSHTSYIRHYQTSQVSHTHAFTCHLTLTHMHKQISHNSKYTVLSTLATPRSLVPRPIMGDMQSYSQSWKLHFSG